MNPKIQQIANAKLTNRNGARRLWLEGRRLSDHGFLPQVRYAMHFNHVTKQLRITLTEAKGRVVQRRRRAGNWSPVIDIANAALSDFFPEGIEQVVARFSNGEIVVEVGPNDEARQERADRLRRKIAASEPLSVGSLCSGAGILDHAVHCGLAAAGVRSRLTFAVEQSALYLDTSLTNNPIWRDGGLAINGDLMDVEQSQIDKVDLLVAGLPCTGASRAGRAAHKHAHPEFHEESGHLFIGFLRILEWANPAAIILEQVPEYRHSISYALIARILRQRGYQVSEQVLGGLDFGAFENRERMCMVAVTDEFPIDLSTLERSPPTTCIGDILDPPENVTNQWSRFDNILERAKSHQEKGNNFAPRVVGADSRQVPTITRGYAYQRGYEVLLRHPTDPGLMRLFTPAEHARLKTIPPDLVRGVAAREAHEMLGQSVIWGAFKAVGACLGKRLRAWARTIAPQHSLLSV